MTMTPEELNKKIRDSSVIFKFELSILTDSEKSELQLRELLGRTASKLFSDLEAIARKYTVKDSFYKIRRVT